MEDHKTEKDLLIRDMPIEALERLSIKAKAVNQDRTEWVRELLVKVSALPETYAFRVRGQVGKGRLSRHSNHPNGTGATYNNFNQDEADAIHRAEDFVRRNAPGDKERAFGILVQQFGADNVFEVPV